MGMANTAEFAGRAVFNPAGGIVLLAGLALVLESEVYDFSMVWILFAIVIVIASAILGGAFSSRRLKTLFALAEERGPADPAVSQSFGTVLNVATIETLILLIVAWVMVFKPGV